MWTGRQQVLAVRTFAPVSPAAKIIAAAPLVPTKDSDI